MGGEIGREKTPSLQKLNTITDARYGGVVGIDRTHTKVYQIFDIDQSSTQKFRDQILARKQLKHPVFLTVSREWIDKYRESCSLQKRFKIIVEYIYMENSLEDLIKDYCRKQMPFPEAGVRKIFFDVVSCLLFLRQNGTCHGDIKPKNILFGSSGRPFLADSWFMNRGRIAYQIVMEDPESLSLLSPEQLQNLRGKKFVSLKNIHQDEMFAVGLTMLQAMTAEPAMECYDLANLKLKPRYFDSKYEQLRMCGYSHQISNLVMACVQIPQNRPTFEQFVSAIQI